MDIPSAVTLCAVIVTALATTYALWQHHRASPVPVWEVVDEYGEREPIGLNTLPVTVLNVGDGDAFNVRIGSKSHILYLADNGDDANLPIARIPVAGRLDVLVQLDLVSGVLVDKPGHKYLDTRKYSDRFVEFHVVWSNPPRRRKRRQRKIRVEIPSRFHARPNVSR